MRRKRKLIKLLTLIVLAAGMSGLGHSYSMWKKVINVDVNASSGNMQVMYDNEQLSSYVASFVDADGESIRDIDSDFLVEDDNKLAEILLSEATPVEHLYKGGGLKLGFSLKPGDGSSVNRFQSMELDFSKKGQSLELKADKAIIVYDSKYYQADIVDVGALEDIYLDAYRQFDFDDESQNSSLYLKIKEDDLNKLNYFNNIIELSEEDLVMIDEDVLANADTNGIIVFYSGDLPVYVDQKQSAPSLFGITAHAYWTDSVSMKLNIPIFYDAEIVLEDVEEEEEEESSISGSVQAGVTDDAALTTESESTVTDVKESLGDTKLEASNDTRAEVKEEVKEKVNEEVKEETSKAPESPVTDNVSIEGSSFTSEIKISE